MRQSENHLPNENRIHISDTTLDQLSDVLRKAVARAGWTSLMPVQARAIPRILAGRDTMIQARTGSGKTGAFLLPLLERIDPNSPQCQVLILVPTRELARQVHGEAEILCNPEGFSSIPVYGGVGYRTQSDALKAGAQIVIGTPGRILDHLLRGTFTLDTLEILIFDEADRMLSMGFYPDMRKLQRHLPKHHVNSYMFSATFPSSVMHTAREFLHDPEFVSLSRDHVHVTDTEHIYYVVPGMEKDRSLVRIIEFENPSSAIIFCNTKAEVHYVSVVLKRFGYDADELSADLNQNQREHVLNRVRKGTLRFLVATDVASRGLDIPELSHVFLYQLPEDPESYIHRAGRTGRAGSVGVAISLVSKLEKYDLDDIAKRYKIDFQKRPLPADKDVEAIVSERVTIMLEARLRDRDKLEIERSRRFIPLARDLAENEDEAAIIAMLLDDYYQQIQHGVIDRPEQKQKTEKRSRGAHSSKRRRRSPRRDGKTRNR